MDRQFGETSPTRRLLSLRGKRRGVVGRAGVLRAHLRVEDGAETQTCCLVTQQLREERQSQSLGGKQTNDQTAQNQKHLLNHFLKLMTTRKTHISLNFYFSCFSLFYSFSLFILLFLKKIFFSVLVFYSVFILFRSLFFYWRDL